MMKAIYKLASASLLVVAIAACNNDLVVENFQNPDVARALGSPSSVEAIIAASYQTVHNGVIDQALWPEVQMLGLETYSALNNFNMGVRVSIPRNPISNANGAPSVFTEFSALEREARLDVDALDALAKLNKGNQSLGTHAQDLRGRAFAWFGAGTSLGWLAMMYDSGGIVTTGMTANQIPPLSGAHDVMKAALSYLDSALLYTTDPTASATGGFPLPPAWMSTTAGMTADQFARLIRSYRAKFRAGVSRTPAEAAQVDWASVIADAESGLQADLLVNTGGTTGWNIGDISQIYVDPGWGEMSMLYYGMADTSGAYANFISQPMGTRSGYFLVQTPDKRWPAGATRAAQQTASVQPTASNSRPYISDRSVPDVPGDGWGVSFYDFYRYKYIRNANNIGLYPEFMKTEVDMLAAEGYIRTGNIAAAAAKIDLTRVAAGLPALSGVVTSVSQPVPGGVGCVPQVPQPPAFNTTACGTILEAMKYEKRIETAYSSFGRFWTDDRGWGDLVTNTAYEYPVPYQEMQARQKPSYNLGGGTGSSAAKGTYGY